MVVYQLSLNFRRTSYLQHFLAGGSESVSIKVTGKPHLLTNLRKYNRNDSTVGLGDTEKSAPRYIMEVFITIIDIIMIWVR